MFHLLKAEVTIALSFRRLKETSLIPVESRSDYCTLFQKAKRN